MRLNVRFIAALIVCLAILASAIHGLHTLQTYRQAEALLREGRRAKEEGKSGQALSYYSRYVKSRPNDFEALGEFGLLLAEAGVIDQAYLVLGRAIALDPSRDDLKLEQVHLAVALHRYTDAQEQLTTDLLKASPTDPELLVLLSRCQNGLGEYQKAADTLGKAIEANPNALDSFEMLAQLYQFRLDRNDDAIAAIDQMVAKNSENYVAYLCRGRWRLSYSGIAGNDSAVPVGGEEKPKALAEASGLQAAAADAKQALQLAPDAIDALLFAAETAVLAGDTGEARRLANHIREIDDRNPDATVVLINVELVERRQDDALALATAAAKEFPTHVPIRWKLANLLLELEKIDEAEVVIAQLKKLELPVGPLSILQARVLTGREEWLAAVKLLEANRSALNDRPDLASFADYQLGRCYEQLGRIDQQLSSYRRALALNPTSQQYRLAVANTLVAAGNLGEALDECKVLVNQNRVPFAAIVNYVRLLLGSDSKRAIEQAEAAINRIERSQPDLKLLPILRAELLLAKGATTEARELLANSRTSSPGQLEFLSAEVLLAINVQDWDAADALLVEAKNRFGADKRYWLLRARYLVQRYRLNSSAPLQQLAKDLEEVELDDKSDVFAFCAGLAYAIQDYDLCASLGTLAQTAAPSDLNVQLLLLECAFRTRDLDKVKTLLADVERIDGRSATWHYSEAARLALLFEESKNADHAQSALARLSEAQAARPSWGRIPLLAAQVYESLDESERALDKYREAFALGERDPIVLKKTISLLFERQKFAEVDQLVRQLDNQGKGLGADVGQVAAQAAFRLGNVDRALDLARAFAARSSDYQDHVWLAQLSVIAGEPQDAEKELRVASELAPSESQPWIALVGVYMQLKDRQAAESTMAAAKEKLPKEEIALFNAQCFELLRDPDEARREYERAVAESPADVDVRIAAVQFLIRVGDRINAVRDLQQLLTLDLTPSKGAWVRRNLAIALAAGNNATDADKALLLLDENARTGEPATADKLARAMILASRPSRDSRQEALKILNAVPSADRGLEQEFLRCKLMIAEGDRESGRRSLRDLVVSNPDKTQYLTTYISVLLDDQDLPEAELWLRRLVEVAPANDATVFDLRTRYLVGAGRSKDAVALLSKVLDSGEEAKRDSPEAQQTRIWVASQLERLANTAAHSELASDQAPLLLAEANNVYQADSSVSVRVAQAQFMSRQGNYADVAKTLGEIIQEATPAQIAGIASSVIMKTPDSPAAAQIKALVKEATKLHPNSATLVAALADISLMEGDYSAAYKAYSAILSARPDDLHSLNNGALAICLSGDKSDRALELISRAIKAAGTQSAFLDTRGLVHLAAGRNQEAIRDFKQAITEKPSPESRFHLALAYQQAGDIAACRKAFAELEAVSFAELELHPSEKDRFNGLRHMLGTVSAE